MRNPAGGRRSRADIEKLIGLARQRDTEKILAEFAESARSAREERPAYAELRRSILLVIQRGASPEQIADLLLRCQPGSPEIDAEEIYDLRERCEGCWRHREDCAADPCGLDAHGGAHEVHLFPDDADQAPPLERSATREV